MSPVPAPKVAIVGGGIGGLATALTFHRYGISAAVYEQAASIRELGVGINILPDAVDVLTELGLLDELTTTGVATSELILAARDGTQLAVVPRGKHGGATHPQISIHRGRLQRILHQAVLDRLGSHSVQCGHRLTRVEHRNGSATMTFDTEQGPRIIEADAVIGADGIHSHVRRSLFPDEGAPHWNGAIIWRGAIEHRSFLTGTSMIIAGGMAAKLVIYPIAPVSSDGRVLTNWAIVRRKGDDGDEPPARESWSRTADRHVVTRELAHFTIDTVDVDALVASTETIYEYPMCDRDPLPWWSNQTITLLGDAAHPMYPVGSNGATQAIVDASCLATQIAESATIAAALDGYETQRRPTTTDIVIANRTGGPESIIDTYENNNLPPP